MAYIFLDESGDLGFDFNKKRTSKYFIITILFAQEKRPLEKIVKKIHSELKKRHKQKTSALHAYREKPITRQRLLRLLSQKDVKILCIYLNKKKVYTHLQDEKAVLYNYVTNILLDRMFTKKLIPLNEKILFISSRKETNKFLNQNFKIYLEKQVMKKHKLQIEIEIKTPPQEKALQVVDFASWAIFRKYEYDDDFYYRIIKENIFEENSLFR